MCESIGRKFFSTLSQSTFQMEVVSFVFKCVFIFFCTKLSGMVIDFFLVFPFNRRIMEPNVDPFLVGAFKERRPELKSERLLLHRMIPLIY